MFYLGVKELFIAETVTKFAFYEMVAVADLVAVFVVNDKISLHLRVQRQPSGDLVAAILIARFIGVFAKTYFFLE